VINSSQNFLYTNICIHRFIIEWVSVRLKSLKLILKIERYFLTEYLKADLEIIVKLVFVKRAKDSWKYLKILRCNIIFKDGASARQKYFQNLTFSN
jgi:hypothetical protein